MLPNGARRSPDASWTPKDEVQRLPVESLEGYWHLCPAFVGWMIDPDNRTVEIYRPDREPESLAGSDSVSGEGPLEGFVLDLRPVWNPLAG